MAIIRITAQEARDFVKKNEVQLQKMYDVAPFSDEVQRNGVKPVACGFTAFSEYIGSKEEEVTERIVQV